MLPFVRHPYNKFVYENLVVDSDVNSKKTRAFYFTYQRFGWFLD